MNMYSEISEKIPRVQLQTTTEHKFKEAMQWGKQFQQAGASS